MDNFIEKHIIKELYQYSHNICVCFNESGFYRAFFVQIHNHSLILLYKCANDMGNPKENQNSLTIRHKLENCYAVGVVSTAQYNMLLKAMETEGVKVELQSYTTKKGQYFKWLTILEAEYS